MYIIPLIRTSRCIVACTILQSNPLLAISSSEIISYGLPFIYNEPLYSISNSMLFLIYYFIFNESAKDIIDKYLNKYSLLYKIEIFGIFVYLFFKFFT